METTNELNYWAKMQVVGLPFAMQDLTRFCLGDYISSGMSRIVFDWRFRPNTVVKFCKGDDCESNWAEYSIWNHVKETPYAKWFCPVIDISPCGRFLLMEKCVPVEFNQKLPKKIPNVFTDIHRGNFGWLNGKFVCLDYQFIGRALDIALCSSMQDVVWDS